MRKLITFNHIDFVEKAETLLFCFVSLLALGYWRSLVITYGWRFIIQSGWWLRFAIAVFLSVVPLIFGDGAWNKLRETMQPYDRRYGLYGAPLITRQFSNPKTTRDRLNFAKNVLLMAIAVWIVVFCTTKRPSCAHLLHSRHYRGPCAGHLRADYGTQGLLSLPLTLRFSGTRNGL